HRIKKVGEEALLEMPIGIILYSDDYQVEWANPYMNKFTEDDTIVGKSLDTISEQLIPLINENKDETWITLDELVFLVTVRSEEHTSELQSRFDLVCRLLLEKKKKRRI